MITLPADWTESECGNTLLGNDDGAIAAWITVDGHCLEVTYTPGNYPAFYVTVIEHNPVKLQKHIVENLGGWFCHRWNVGEFPAPVDRSGRIVGAPDVYGDS